MSEPRTDVLLVAAHAPELVGFRSELSDAFEGVIRGLHVRAKTVGIGMPAAASSMGRRIVQLSPRAVVLVGSCGIYPGRASVEGRGSVEPLDILVAERAVLVDSAVVQQRGAFPDPMQVSVQADAGLGLGLVAQAERARRSVIGTTLSITTDDALANAIGQSGVCDAENLEAFSIALACAQANIPFAAVLGVTNVVGSTGRVDWGRFQRQAAVSVAELVLRWLHNGAQGLPHG
jgi:nucleoside phosphorylase